MLKKYCFGTQVSYWHKCWKIQYIAIVVEVFRKGMRNPALDQNEKQTRRRRYSSGTEKKKPPQEKQRYRSVKDISSGSFIPFVFKRSLREFTGGTALSSGELLKQRTLIQQQ